MLFSLILCTINRTKEVDNFLKALARQNYKSFEVIMIDQNDDDRLIPIINKYENQFSLQHIRSKKGLSLARNVGLIYAKGDVIAFPDDDCLYPRELLQNVAIFFKEDSYAILMGKTIDKESTQVVAGKAVHEKQKLSCYNFLGSSTTMFMNLDYIEKEEIKFDENFGLGALFHSGEEEDLMMRLLSKGYKGFYNPEINFVYHPPSDLDFSDLVRVRIRSIGLGALVMKHFFSLCGQFYLWKYVFIHPFVSIMKSIFKWNMPMIKYNLNRFAGICIGMVKYTIMIVSKNKS